MQGTISIHRHAGIGLNASLAQRDSMFDIMQAVAAEFDDRRRRIIPMVCPADVPPARVAATVAHRPCRMIVRGGRFGRQGRGLCLVGRLVNIGAQAVACSVNA